MKTLYKKKQIVYIQSQVHSESTLFGYLNKKPDVLKRQMHKYTICVNQI